MGDGPCIVTENDTSPEGAAAAAAKPLQSCPTPCDPIDGSPPGSYVPGILQAKILEWVATSFSIFQAKLIEKNSQNQICMK